MQPGGPEVRAEFQPLSAPGWEPLEGSASPALAANVARPRQAAGLLPPAPRAGDSPGKCGQRGAAAALRACLPGFV